MQLLPQYTHIVNKRLKHTYLTFDEEGNLIIKSPKISQDYIEKILLEKSTWINKSRKKILEKRGKSFGFGDGKKLYFYGKAYDLILKEHAEESMRFDFNSTEFILHYHDYNEEFFQRYIDNFYKEAAEHAIPSLVEKWSKVMNLKANKISFRKTKRQWGSCSSKNNLSFNTMLIKLPYGVIEYIVVHELAHIKHKHHQRAFWNEIAKYMPNYKQHTVELKKYSTQ